MRGEEPLTVCSSPFTVKATQEVLNDTIIELFYGVSFCGRFHPVFPGPGDFSLGLVRWPFMLRRPGLDSE